MDDASSTNSGDRRSRPRYDGSAKAYKPWAIKAKAYLRKHAHLQFVLDAAEDPTASTGHEVAGGEPQTTINDRGSSSCSVSACLHLVHAASRANKTPAVRKGRHHQSSGTQANAQCNWREVKSSAWRISLLGTWARGRSPGTAREAAAAAKSQRMCPGAHGAVIVVIYRKRV